MSTYIMHVYGEHGRSGKEYHVEAVSEVKARAQAKAMFWDDTKTPAIAVEWVKFLANVPR